MAPNRQILIVDDEKNIRQTLGMILEPEGYAVGEADCGKAALKSVEASEPDAILLDLQLGDMDGLEVLQQLHRQGRRTPTIVISGHGTIQHAVEAMKEGAYDYLEKPLTKERVLMTLARLFERRDLLAENQELKERLGDRMELIGETEAMRSLYDQIAKAAPSKGRILITGESGAGKELIALAVHRNSDRKNRPFVKVNCAAIPSELIESELFGHIKGSFSGAVKDRKGKFAAADKGTIFLDEIGDMSLSAQAKVLRALQTGEIAPVGSEENFKVDVRVIAATNRDLSQAIAEEKFREDLFYRLNVVPLNAPPLRERKADIPLLVDRFLKEFCRENGVRPKSMTAQAMESMKGYRWPGNVRELKNIVERVVIMGGEVIDRLDLPPEIVGGGDGATSDSAFPEGMSLKEIKEWAEKRYILAALEANDHHVSRTAERLGVERTHLHKKIRQYGLRSAESETKNG